MAIHREPGDPLSWLDVLQAVGAHFVPLCMVVLEMFDNTVGYWNWKRIWPIIVMAVGYLLINAVYSVGKRTIRT